MAALRSRKWDAQISAYSWDPSTGLLEPHPPTARPRPSAFPREYTALLISQLTLAVKVGLILPSQSRATIHRCSSTVLLSVRCLSQIPNRNPYQDKGPSWLSLLPLIGCSRFARLFLSSRATCLPLDHLPLIACTHELLGSSRSKNLSTIAAPAIE